MNLVELDTRLNEKIQAGEILDTLDEFYAENATFQEGNERPREGRETQRQHLSAFFETLEKFNGATLHAQAVGENVSIGEWTFDMVGPDGPIVWNEVLRRVWEDGKIVSERFYTAS